MNPLSWDSSDPYLHCLLIFHPLYTAPIPGPRATLFLPKFSGTFGRAFEFLSIAIVCTYMVSVVGWIKCSVIVAETKVRFLVGPF